jgi:serine/threonine protein kinase/tetratricopeptide (TPR) repeat protein
LRRLFEKAFQLPPHARASFLDTKCSKDPELKQRLQAMLAAAGDDQFKTSASGHVPPLPAAADPVALREGPGTRIGPYKLLTQIGEGGFGAVFMAEQTEPVVRKVALKVIKLGMDTRQVVARFEQERQALALMDHPNIARVFDAGATQTGRPYFVMELCNGVPIVEYCDTNNLTIDKRLELMEQVCAAIQHAHQKGIIHRDLKPSNILVGTQDGRAQAKVIDFGVAKATSQKLTDKTLFTEHQQVIGTLQYMSPEQAEGSLDIDTRADVYSLGVLLYELLTGSTPFDRRTLQNAMYSEIQRMIREVEPNKPSTRISSNQALASIAAHRRVEPQRLGPLVRGELDWIVMKAIDKDRTRRYETANGLAMDLRRYLNGDAVVAAPPSTAYRLRKFVRRNRGLVAAVGAVGLSLLAGVIAFAWQTRIAQGERDAALVAQAAEATQRREAEEQRRVADEQRALAERNQAKADAINQFLLDMLGAADVRELGREAKVAQALDQAAATVRKAFAERPEVEAAVRQILGRTYVSIGMLDEAEPQIEASIELNRSVHGEASSEYARALHSLAALKQARGERKAALDLFAKAGEIATKAAGAEGAAALGARTQYANLLVELERTSEAEVILREVLATRIRVFGRDANDTQIAFNSLAVLLHKLERLDEAEELYREAVEIGQRALGGEHADTLTARMNLASLLRSRGKVAEAEPMMVTLCADLRKVFGESHTKTAEASKVLAELYRDLGRFKDAAPLLEECVAIRRRAQGEETQGVADAKVALALVLQRLGEASRAVTLQREVAATYARLHGAESSRTLNTRLNLANSLDARGADEAEAIFKDVLEVSRRALGEDSEPHIIASNSYGVFLMGKERFADAAPFVRKALEIGERAEGVEHRNTVISRHNLARIELELGHLDEAERLGRECVDQFTRVFGAGHPNTATARGGLGRTLVRLGRHDEARREFTAAIAICKAALGEQNQGFCDHALELGRLLCDTGCAGEAEPVLREAAAVYEKARGLDDRRTANTRLELGRCCQLLRRFGEAEPLLVASHGTLVVVRRAGHQDVKRAERYLAALYVAWHAAEPDAARAAKAAEWQAKAEASR